MINIPCKEDQHNEKLKYYCFNNLCTESRLGCQQCINTGKHKDHQVFEISQLDELRKVYQGKCQHIIDNLFILKSQLIEIIDEQIKNLQEKFQQRQNNFFTYEQIDSYMQDFLIFNQHKDDVIVSLKQVKNDIQIAVNQLKVKESSQQETQQQFQRDFYSFINDSTQNQDIIQAQTQDLEITNQLVMKGKLLLSQTKNYEAYNTFDRVRKIDPMNKDALNGLGDCLRERSKYDDALEYYEATLELDQNNKQALIGKALCLGKLKKFQEARPIFERILNQDKNDIDAIWGLANLLRLQGKDEEAIKQYNKALQLNQNHLESISGLGDCYRLLGKFDDAMKYLKKALQINPRHALSLVRMGDCLRLQKKFLEAMNFYSEALAIDPNDDWCKSKLNECRIKSKAGM
ncbi:unnamed protein product [Paramecium octaurelia]|uniref:Tetratricopeptide repeat protein n=1 Tax=Paramecium octaurelia TaxID=43137 RepID=A0A8S1XPE7_PAROT|nr:unnamed protein product [Paramecium octaurelia]